MKVIPWNRRLLITMEDSQEDESAILVPEDYNPKVNEFLGAHVDAGSEGSDSQLVGKRVVLTPNGLEEVNIKGQTYYLVLENYVVCVVEDD